MGSKAFFRYTLEDFIKLRAIVIEFISGQFFSVCLFHSLKGGQLNGFLSVLKFNLINDLNAFFNVFILTE